MRSDRSIVLVRASLCAALSVQLLLLACSTKSEGEWTQSALDDLSEVEQAELDDFVRRIRAAYEAGDHATIRDLSDTSQMPPPLARLNNRGSIPKGPREVTAIRIEPIQLKEGPLLRYEEHDYVYNVESLGRLVVEMNDVSIGPVSTQVIFGRKNGRFRLAALEPIGTTSPADP